MAIYRLLQNSAFAPEDIIPLVAAYEDCLQILKASDRSDPTTEMVAKKIIEIAQTGIGVWSSSVDWRLRNSEFPTVDERWPSTRGHGVRPRHQCRFVAPHP
jgi:hypothetical protein